MSEVATAAPIAGADASPRGGSSGPVAYCPRCGERLGARGFVQEFWVASETVYHCWCRACGFIWNLTPVERVVTHEAEH